MKVGFTCGAFDLLHAGHITMLEECKQNCDYLIVGLQTDPSIDRKDKNKPVQSLLERQIQLKGCKYVDDVYVYTTEEDLYNMLSTLKIDIRFIGMDWFGKNFTGRDIEGIEIYYNQRKHKLSSSSLRTRILQKV